MTLLISDDVLGSWLVLVDCCHLQGSRVVSKDFAANLDDRAISVQRDVACCSGQSQQNSVKPVQDFAVLKSAAAISGSQFPECTAPHQPDWHLGEGASTSKLLCSRSILFLHFATSC